MLRTYLTIYLVFILSKTLFSQNMVINEVLLTPNQEFPRPWIEFKNTGFDTVNLREYRISFNSLMPSRTVGMPDANIPPNGYLVLYILQRGDTEIQPFIHFDYEKVKTNISLLNGEGNLIDSLRLVSSFMAGESFGRFPENSRSCIFFPESKVSPGSKNIYPGPWVKLTNDTDFSPRDSSPNACIVYDNKFWIFEGWEYNNGVFASRSNIWVSEDMVNWELVNDQPPYNPYSAYVAYKGKMWAFDDKCWSSTDGISWIEESDYFPGSVVTRVTVLRDTLWFAKARSVGYSINGKDWNFKHHGTAPWSSRDWPGFIAFDNKLWYFGGGHVFGPLDHHYYNDVWVSENGESWDLVTDNAPWPGRFWFSYAVFDQKLWLFGGYDVYAQDVEYGNMNDIWYTKDGLQWEKFEPDNVWTNRHAQLTFSTDSSVFISSGYSSGGVSRLHNDVWKFSLKKIQPIDFQLITLTYGDQVPIESLIGNTDFRLSAGENSPVELTSTVLEATAAGVASIKVSLPATENYFENDTLINIEVRKKDLLVEAGEYSKVFAEENPNFDLKFNGFIQEDTPDSLDNPPKFESVVTKFSRIGNYPVYLQGGNDNNYNFILKEGILTVLKGDGPAFFPNPATDFINIFLDACSGQNQSDNFLSLQIMDNTGREVRKLRVSCEDQIPINISDMRAGMYLMKIGFGNQLYLKKLTIQ